MKFEQAFADWCGASTTSRRWAPARCMWRSRVSEPRDEVIVPSYTFTRLRSRCARRALSPYSPTSRRAATRSGAGYRSKVSDRTAAIIWCTCTAKCATWTRLWMSRSDNLKVVEDRRRHGATPEAQGRTPAIWRVLVLPVKTFTTGGEVAVSSRTTRRWTFRELIRLRRRKAPGSARDGGGPADPPHVGSTTMTKWSAIGLKSWSIDRGTREPQAQRRDAD